MRMLTLDIPTTDATSIFRHHRTGTIRRASRSTRQRMLMLFQCTKRIETPFQHCHFLNGTRQTWGLSQPIVGQVDLLQGRQVVQRRNCRQRTTGHFQLNQRSGPAELRRERMNSGLGQVKISQTLKFHQFHGYCRQRIVIKMKKHELMLPLIQSLVWNGCERRVGQEKRKTDRGQLIQHWGHLPDRIAIQNNTQQSWHVVDLDLKGTQVEKSEFQHLQMNQMVNVW